MGIENNNPIDPCDFVKAVKPLLARRDAAGLMELARSRWTADQVVSLLACKDCDARKIAALCLSLAGGKCCIEPLALRLRDPDPMVAQMAEHALWSIWFRCGTAEANLEIFAGMQSLNVQNFPGAITHFDRAVTLDPNFAEAFNQRAIAHYMLEDYRASIRDCRAAIERMPCHIGAWSGLGHCHACLGEFDAAICAYTRALELHPHLDDIREALDQIRDARLDAPRPADPLAAEMMDYGADRRMTG